MMLKSDRTLNNIDLQGVGDKNVAVGMSVCGAIAALGKPSDVNATTTASNTKIQLVYRSPRMYIYSQGAPNDANGVVYAIQQ